jgi:hypothetical protein
VNQHSETKELSQEVKMYRQDITTDLSRYHYIQAMTQMNEIALERGNALYCWKRH